MAFFTGEVKPQAICPISGDAFPDSSTFKEIEGLKVCPRCQTNPTIKLQCKEFVQKATYEREQLARRIEKNKLEEESNNYNAKTTTKGTPIWCEECGRSQRFGKLTKRGTKWLCEPCQNIKRRPAGSN